MMKGRESGVLTCLLVSLLTYSSPAQVEKIFVAPSAHTDVGYTHIQSKIPEIHNQNIDLAMELFGEYPQFKWNLEVAWQAENYLRDRPQETDKFIGYLGEGMLGVGALYLNMLTQLCSSEELNRICYYAGYLKRRYGIKPRFALLSDVPTAVATLPSVLAGSGVKYFAHAVNQDRAPVYWYRDYPDSPYWWEGPDGGKVLVWNTPHRYIDGWRMMGYAQAQNLGMDTSCSSLLRNLEKFLSEFQQEQQYPYDAVLVYGAVSDNRSFSERLPQVVEEWNGELEHPKIIFCTTDEFFSYLEENFRDKIPTLSGDEGGYWEDGAISSAKETAINRQTHEAIISAEKISSILGWLNPDIKYPKAQFDSCWKNIFLYNEHTWGANCSIMLPVARRTKEQWEIKSSYAYQASKLVSQLLAEGMERFAGLIQTKENPLIFVFNPLSWSRTAIVRVSYFPQKQKFILRDSSSEEVYFQQEDDEIYFLARDVPPVGYKIFQIIEGQEQPWQPPGVRFFGDGLENKFYRIELDPQTGGIRSVWDKELGYEFVDKESRYKFNQYLYVTGGRGTRAVRPEKDLPRPDFEFHNPAGVKISAGANGPVFGELLVESSARLTPWIKQKIILYSHIKRIDLINQFEKEPTYEKEAVYFSFPFNFRNPQIRIEIPDGVIRPEIDQIGGACRDWHCVQHWLSISDGKRGIVWASPDSPLVCLAGINPGKWLETLNMDNGTIFAYVMNNYWYTNYKASQGGARFRYAITTHSGESKDSKSIHFGAGVSNPVLTRVIPRYQNGGITEDSGSFCKVDSPDVIILAMKQAEDKQGWIIRLLETSGYPAEVKVTLPFSKPGQAWLCNLVEENISPLEVKGSIIQCPVRANGIVTMRIKN